MSVPDTAPYVWVRLSRDGIEVDLNDPKTAVKDYPGLAGKPLGATGCLFIEVEGVRALHDVLARKAKLRDATDHAALWHDGIRHRGSGRLCAHLC
jgi:hypothetical protein